MATEVDDEKIDIENSEEDGKNESDRADSPVSSLSLDVLAQVASDRLQTDDNKTTLKASMKDKGSKKTPKRALQSLDRLNLPQIRSLSNKLLVSLFSEMTSDELRKQYTLTCLLEPDACSQKVTVYGNEMKAKTEMQRHLLQHLAGLALKYKHNPESYIAETLPGRKKKFMAKKKWELKDKRKKKSGSGGNPYPPTYNAKYRRGRPPMFPQTLHDYADLGYEIDKEELQKAVQAGQPVGVETGESSRMDLGEGTSEQSHAMQIDTTHQQISLLSLQQQQQQQPAEQTPQTEETIDDNDSEATVSEDETRYSAAGDIDKEALILSLLAKSQPYADHNYTSILGKKKGIELVPFDDSEDESQNEVSSSKAAAASTKGQFYSLMPDKVSKDDKPPITVKISGEPGKDPTMLHVPIIKLPPLPLLTKRDFISKTLAQRESEPTPEEQVLDALTRLAEKMTEQKKNAAAAEPSQTPEVEKPVETIPSPAGEDQVVNKDANPYKRGRRGYETTSGEWERKAALKCIKELRLRRKFETSLMCKICKDKTFTATATLMYHYRSHAGIKPFVCLICNTTFTRQHSLNYHMLIHNNQSRFTCKECGRKFRHPSHFKEHMRRHTGETPYHCTDCPLRFKTRNTYKRHLRTRHDKLLTVLGIRFMTQEEKSRVGTIQESDKEEGDESTESDTSQEDIKDLQSNLIPIRPKPPTYNNQQQQQQIQPSNNNTQLPTAETLDKRPQITITDDSPLGQIQSIEASASSSNKMLQNQAQTSSTVTQVTNVLANLTQPTVTPVKIDPPSLFVTQGLISGGGGVGGGSIAIMTSSGDGSLLDNKPVSATGVSAAAAVASSSGLTQVVSATPTIQLQVPTIVQASHQHTQSQSTDTTLNLTAADTTPRIQLLTPSGLPIQIPQLVQTTPTAVAQLIPTVGPQLVLAPPSHTTSGFTITPSQAQGNTLSLTQNTANIVGTNGIINVPINQATFQLGGQFTGQNAAIQSGGISLLTMANPGGVVNNTSSTNQQGIPGANTVTLQMKSNESFVMANNSLPPLTYHGNVVSQVGASRVTNVTNAANSSITLQSSSTNTPATNTLLKFCTQVANKAGQMVPPNV